MTKIQIWIFLRILIGFQKFFRPKESICLRCWKKIVFFLDSPTHFWAGAPSAFRNFCLKNAKNEQKFFYVNFFKKKEKNFFLSPIGRGHIIVEKLLTLFFFHFFFVLNLPSKFSHVRNFYQKKSNFAFTFSREFQSNKFKLYFLNVSAT